MQDETHASCDTQSMQTCHHLVLIYVVHASVACLCAGATSDLRPLLAAIMVGGRATSAALGKALSLLAQRKQLAGKQVRRGRGRSWGKFMLCNSRSGLSVTCFMCMVTWCWDNVSHFHSGTVVYTLILCSHVIAT
jgi:hypothetical protein